MRILVWHGYLLSGTGSNIYTQALVREWARAGHDVTVFSQEPHPEQFDLAGATAVRPRIGPVLPVFVLDRYEGLEARLLQDLTQAERDAYVEANAAALREHLPADLVFANHVLLGGPVGAATGARFAVKAHGSELEYSMRGNDELSAWGRESLKDAAAVYVGSAHIREVLEDVVGHVDRVQEVPPGVDVDEFRPEDRDVALAALLDELRSDPPNPGDANERVPDEGNAERLAEWFASDRPTVLYFGKLLYNKGVHVLFDALRELGDVRALIVGFGDYREELERIAPPRHALHGPARAPPPGPPDPAVRRDGRAVDLPRGVRHGRGGGGCRRLAAARRPALRARGDRRGPRRASLRLRDRRRRRPRAEAAGAARAPRGRAAEACRRGAAHRRREVVVAERRRAAAQLIRPSIAAVASFMRSSCGPLSSSHGLPVERT